MLHEAGVVTAREVSWKDPASGRQIAYYVWQPSKVRALTVVLHGFGEHAGRYRWFAERLAEQGIAVAAPDLWGHGRSDGARGDFQEPSKFLQALDRLTRTVWLPETGQSAYSLFGHSFGGLLAIAWALEGSPQLHRLVAQSPLLEVGFPIPQWKISAALWLAAHWPGVPFSMDLDLNDLCRNAEVVQAYRQDRLVHNKMTAGTYRAVTQLRNDVFAHTYSLHVPTLLLCAMADRIVSLAAARLWFSRLPGEKRRVDFPDCYHELHHEPVRDEVARLVTDWMLQDA